MQCDEFQTRLNSVLDERRDPDSDSQLSQHVQGCALCRETLKVGSQLANLWTLPDETNVERQANSTNTGPRVVLGIFATVVVLLIMAWGWSQPTPSQIGNVAAIEEVVLPEPQMVSEVTLNPITKNEAAFVHQPLISLGLLSTAGWNYPLEEVPAPFAATLSDIQPRWKAVSGGMAPVQKSMSKTFAAIKRSLSS